MNIHDGKGYNGCFYNVFVVVFNQNLEGYPVENDSLRLKMYLQ